MYKYMIIFLSLAILSVGLSQDAMAQSGHVSLEKTTHIYGQSEQHELFGSSIANIGDLDGDGIDEMAVGAPHLLIRHFEEGHIYILFLNADGTVKNTIEINTTTDNGPANLNAGDHFGNSVASLGDLDGAGPSDVAIAVGAPGHISTYGQLPTGEIYVLYLDYDSQRNNVSIIKTVEINNTTPIGGVSNTHLDLEAHDQFGFSVTNLGDLDGSGASVTAIAVGAPHHPHPDEPENFVGSVYILFLDSEANVLSYTEINGHVVEAFSHLEDDDQFGESVAALGDLDGDGPSVAAIAVGAPGHQVGGLSTGDVYIVFLNSDGTVNNMKEINSTTPNVPALADNDRFGFAVSIVDDLNGDDINDLAVGAPGHLVGSDHIGDVYILFLDMDGSVKGSVELNTMTPNGPREDHREDYTTDLFGHSLATVGDLDGNGVHELAIGAPGSDSVFIAFLQEGDYILPATLQVSAFLDMNGDGKRGADENAYMNLPVLTYVPATSEADLLITGSTTISTSMPVNTEFYAIALPPEDYLITTHDFILGTTTYNGVINETAESGSVHTMEIGIWKDPCTLIPEGNLADILLMCPDP